LFWTCKTGYIAKQKPVFNESKLEESETLQVENMKLIKHECGIIDLFYLGVKGKMPEGRMAE